MTIVASVKVRDGLILGTDSMTQISSMTEEGPQLLKGYSNARKLFQIEPRPVGVMTYGFGNIGNILIRFPFLASFSCVLGLLLQFLGSIWHSLLTI